MSNRSFTIRPAAPSDVPAILGFIRELAAFEKLLHEVEATEERLKATLFPSAGRGSAECVIAESDGTPAGFALFFTNYSTFLARPGLYLEDLYVSPAHRGQGLGRGLLTHLAALAVERGYGRMEWSVLDWNQSAIDLYEAFGARRMHEWTVCRLTGAALQRHGRTTA